MMWERENRVREWRQSEDGRERNIKRKRLWESNNFCRKNDVILAAFSPARTQPVPRIFFFFFGKKGISLGYACSSTQAVSVSQQCPVWVRHPNCCIVLHRCKIRWYELIQELYSPQLWSRLCLLFIMILYRSLEDDYNQLRSSMTTQQLNRVQTETQLYQRRS